MIAAQQMIMKLGKEVQSLKRQNEEKEKRITSSDSRVADLEQDTRINRRFKDQTTGLFNSGIRRLCWSRGQTLRERETLEHEVVGFLDVKGDSMTAAVKSLVIRDPVKTKTHTQQ